MKKRHVLKSIMASILVTVSLVLPIAVLGDILTTYEALLSFEGAQLRVMDDGSVQALFDVKVGSVEYGDGASFQLNYNPKYLTPSDHKTNVPLPAGTMQQTDSFFQVDPTLYGVKNPDGSYVNPYRTTVDDTGESYSLVDTATHTISMNLWLRTKGLQKGGKIDKIFPTEDENEACFVFSSKDARVSLGTISFQVNKELLPEVVRLYGSISDAKDPKGTDGTYLLRVPPLLPTDAEDNWTVGAYIFSGDLATHHIYGLNQTTAVPGHNMSNATDCYTFLFPKTAILVNATNPALTINAYQGYTKGTADDIPMSLQKYSPMVTVTYADGGVENVVFPWGKAGTDFTVAAPVPPYTSYQTTGGRYSASQFYYDAAGQKFPVPVVADLTVTPIRLMEVTADDLMRSYQVREVVSQVQSGGALALPEQAYLITDVNPGGVSMYMEIPGWSPTNTAGGSAWPTGSNAATIMNSLKADGVTDGTVYWPDDADAAGIAANPLNWDKHVGRYTFQMTTSYASNTPAVFTKAAIERDYPWLTVPQESYSLDNGVRRITKDNGGETIATDYSVTYHSTAADAQDNPILTLHVEKVTDPRSLPDTVKFRIRLPNGLEMGTGLDHNNVDVGPVSLDNWFDGTTGSYSADKVTNVTNQNSYNLVSNPGDTADTTAFYAPREVLRRYINLGGWFSVAINEEDTTDRWSEFIPVYVPPRTNLYTQDKTYHFLGWNAALLGPIYQAGDRFALPQGTYGVVNEKGVPLYQDEAGQPTTDETLTGRRYEEHYGVSTTYDGATGAQPGTLHTIAVDKSTGAWLVQNDGTTDPSVGGRPIFRNGPAPFLDGARYAAYGAVSQPSTNQMVTLRRESADATAAAEQITLTCDSATGITREPPATLGSNVTLVTYDTLPQGYTLRQNYTLTITNVGTTDIYGIDIDGLTDGYLGEPTGGRFEVLQPPASFLAPGSSTTFVLTYVYDLRTGGGGGMFPYRDTLYITSQGHPTGGAGGDYLRAFDAQFTVTDSKVHKVTVVTNPADGSLGTAGLIIGQQTDTDGKNTMDYTPATSTYADGVTVYVVVRPQDEYTVSSIECVDTTGGKTTLSQYNPTGDGVGLAVLDDGTLVYTFTMPAYDATVTVTLVEDIYSKLRLSDLIDFSAGDKSDLKTKVGNTVSGTVDPANTYSVWRKSFTDVEKKAAADWGIGGRKPQEYLMTAGRAIPGTAGNKFVSSEDQYLVVIPFAADFSQVEAKLRKVVHTTTGAGVNGNITPVVTMDLFPQSPVGGSGITTQIMQPETGNTATPTAHTSNIFDSPTPGTSVYVRVTVQFSETAVTTYRYYYLEIHRGPEHVAAIQNYGNSPYGMIMNASKLQVAGNPTQTAKNQAAAKDAFVKAGYTFHGVNTIYLPAVVEASGISNVTYWREAWVSDGMLYEPETGLGVGDGTVYDDGNNLDLNDYALFALLGQDLKDPGLERALDSSGREIDLTQVQVSAQVVLLDDTAATQIDRFNGYDPATPGALPVVKRLTMGLAGAQYDKDVWVCETVQPTDPITGLPQVDAEGKPVYVQQRVDHIRPGRYALVYTFTDYDGTTQLTVERPFVVLRPVGDINSDGVVTGTHTPGTDEALVEGRLTAPLGYLAPLYTNANIFKYRTCDLNNDRNINNIDANHIRALTTGTPDLVFYLPTGYVG